MHHIGLLCGVHQESHYGLVVNPIYLHLGTSPGGRVDCACCGSGVIEIKCPYKYRHVKIKEINDSIVYLLKTSDGLKLNPNHEYFFQVQMQMATCDVKYCDFVVWTMQSIVTIRINAYPQLSQFVQCILPSLLVPHKNSVQVPDPQPTDNSTGTID